MDIKINANKLNFKFRVAGMLIVDNKVLTVQIMDNGFYCLPGGHVNIGETTISAIEREMVEETGFEVKVDKLLTIIENFFTRKNGEIVHELSYIYLLKPSKNIKIDTNDYITYEEDEEGKKKLEFKWIPLEGIYKYTVRPVIISKIINKKFKYFVIKDGEVEKCIKI